MLIYGWKFTLVINYGKYKSSIIERLLEITEKVSQLREAARKSNIKVISQIGQEVWRNENTSLLKRGFSIVFW